LKETTKKRPTLKELEEKKHLFPNFDLSGTIGDLLENKVTKLLEPKRSEEAGRTNDPKYCRYHRVIRHPIEKCVKLKEHIMQLDKDEKIILDLDHIIEAQCIYAQLESSCPLGEGHVQFHWLERCDLTCSLRVDLFTIQFESLEAIIIPLMVK